MVAALTAAAAAWASKPAARIAAQPIARLDVTLPQGDRIGDLFSPAIAFAPDGRSVAYVGRHDGTTEIFVRAIDSLDTRRIPGS